MDHALGWIGDIVQFFFRLLPWPILIKRTHEGVAFRHGRDAVRLTAYNGVYLPWFADGIWFRRSGLHFYLPTVTEVVTAPINRRTLNLDYQYMTTKDGATVGTSSIVVYEIFDVINLFLRNNDYEDTIRDITLGAVEEALSDITLKDLQLNRRDVKKKLTRAVKRELHFYGVRVKQVRLSDSVHCDMKGVLIAGMGAVASHPVPVVQ